MWPLWGTRLHPCPHSFDRLILWRASPKSTSLPNGSTEHGSNGNELISRLGCRIWYSGDWNHLCVRERPTSNLNRLVLGLILTHDAAEAGLMEHVQPPDARLSGFRPVAHIMGHQGLLLLVLDDAVIDLVGRVQQYKKTQKLSLPSISWRCSGSVTQLIAWPSSRSSCQTYPGIPTWFVELVQARFFLLIFTFINYILLTSIHKFRCSTTSRDSRLDWKTTQAVYFVLPCLEWDS
jgi:hypothetical protein